VESEAAPELAAPRPDGLTVAALTGLAPAKAVTASLPRANGPDYGDYADAEYERLRLMFPDMFEGET
jgi:hypothetical protein